MTDGKKCSRFTFDSFEVTKTNSKAFEKAKQFAENVDSKSLAIFGGTATGKTHLLYAVKKMQLSRIRLIFMLSSPQQQIWWPLLQISSVTAVQQSSSVRSICRRMSY